MLHNIVDVGEDFGLLCKRLRPVWIQMKRVGIVLLSSFVSNRKKFHLLSRITASGGIAHTWESTSQLRLG